MQSYVDFGNQLVAFPKMPQALRADALQITVATLETIAATLKLDVNNFIVQPECTSKGDIQKMKREQ
jgi:hypothetical protein